MGSPIEMPRFGRGFTGHEHLVEFDLINMNGRMYDPVMSSFLSVDNYIQSPDFSQSFNRYAYCLNNPLKYTDPSGEIPVLAVVAIGAAVNVIMNGINNVRHGENFFHGAGPAAVTGGVQGLFTYGIGESANAIGTAIKNQATAHLAKAGFQLVAHGTMGGMATMWRGGAFWQGFVSSATASVISGAVGLTCTHFKVPEGWTTAAMIAAGGLSGGVSASMAGGDFWDGVCNGLICAGLNHALHWVAEGVTFVKGCMALGISLTGPIPEGLQNDAFLKQAQEAWYKDAPMDKVKAFTVENVPAQQQIDMNYAGASAVTIPENLNGKISGISNVYFNKNLAFSSAKQLFFTMGHEFVHVSQFAALASQQYSLLTPDFLDMLDFHAYSYQNSIGGLQLNSYTKEELLRWSSLYPQFSDMNYINFPWTSNHSFQYPF